nr:far upstream element-binding protein 1 [Tanacetum cinerariifolium]
MAEELILDKVPKTYMSVCYPVFLMPPTVYGYKLKIHKNMVINQEDNRKAQHIIGNCCRSTTCLSKYLKATIGLLADIETNKHNHTYLDLVGTVEQVNMAEELILDKVPKTYMSVCYPVFLMPPTVYGYKLKIHKNMAPHVNLQ